MLKIYCSISEAETSHLSKVTCDVLTQMHVSKQREANIILWENILKFSKCFENDYHYCLL